MKNIRLEYRVIPVLFFLLISIFPLFSQETENTAQESSSDFFLLPILEILFSQNVKWRPDWPSDIPFDGFTVNKDSGKYEVVELSNANDTFTVKYNREGKLLEFPFFYYNSYAQINAVYTDLGALSKMDIILKNYSSSDKENQTEDNKTEDNQNEERILTVNFPDNFLPYSEMSPGGAFPVISLSLDDTLYHVFIFESPVFLSETWFDSEGNMLLFCKANVNVENSVWRIESMEIQNIDEALFVDYFYDSYGNITQIESSDGLFSSLYNENKPSYWRNYTQQYELFWDTQSILRVVKTALLDGDIYTEYRYEYDFDNTGNWIKRMETARVLSSNLLVPNPAYVRGIWKRRIVYFE